MCDDTAMDDPDFLEDCWLDLLDADADAVVGYDGHCSDNSSCNCRH